MGRLPNNKVWEYFDYMSDAVAQCQLCKATILTPSNRRQNMTRHLFDLHGINTYTAGSKVGLKPKPSSTKRKRRKLQKYVKDIRETFSLQEGNKLEKVKGIKINNDGNDQSDDDSELESNSNRLSEGEHSTDPLLDILKIEEPVVGTKRIQYPNKEELNNISYGSTLNQSNNNLKNPIEHSLLSEKYVTKEDPLDSQNEAELLKVKALAEKLKAEARYFNELAELTRSKRIYIDLQCQQLKNQINSSPTTSANFNSTTNLTDSFFPTDI